MMTYKVGDLVLINSRPLELENEPGVVMEVNRFPNFYYHVQTLIAYYPIPLREIELTPLEENQ